MARPLPIVLKTRLGLPLPFPHYSSLHISNTLVALILALQVLPVFSPSTLIAGVKIFRPSDHSSSLSEEHPPPAGGLPTIIGDNVTADRERIHSILKKSGNLAADVMLRDPTVLIYGLTSQLTVSEEKQSPDLRKLSALQLLGTLFLRPPTADTQSSCKQDDLILAWKYIGEESSMDNSHIAIFQQELNGISVRGASARVHFNVKDVIESIFATPINCKHLRLLSSQFGTPAAMPLDKDAAAAEAKKDLKAFLSRFSPAPDLRGGPEVEDVEIKATSHQFLLHSKRGLREIWEVNLAVSFPEDSTRQQLWTYMVDRLGGDILSRERVEASKVAPYHRLASGDSKFAPGQPWSFSVICDPSPSDRCRLENKETVPVAGDDKTIPVRILLGVSAGTEKPVEAKGTHFGPYYGSANDLFHWLLELRKELAQLGKCSYDGKCADIEARIYLANNPRGAIYDPATRRLAFYQVPGANWHTGSDPAVVAHELVHMLLRGPRTSAIEVEKCRDKDGEEFGALEESLADTIAVLLTNKLVTLPDPYKVGAQSLGTSSRDMKTPPVLTTANMKHVRCSPDRIDDSVTYLNSGIPSRAAYLLLSKTPKEVGLFATDEEWKDFVLKNYLRAAEKVYCNVSNCSTFEEFATMLAMTFHFQIPWGGTLKDMVLNTWCQVGVKVTKDTNC